MAQVKKAHPSEVAEVSTVGIGDFESEGDLKAHIHQQIAFLEPLIGPGAQAAVLLRREEGGPSSLKTESGGTSRLSQGPLPKPVFVADLRVAINGEILRVEASEQTPYEAVITARHSMQVLLVEIRSGDVQAGDRDTAIDAIRNKVFVH